MQYSTSLKNMFNPIKYFTDRHYRNAEMVSYWKTKDSVEAKVVLSKQGHYEMHMDGEKYPFPGFPRGNLLFGKLSPLKHVIKNRIFNDSWVKLEQGEKIDLKDAFREIETLYEGIRYDILPIEKCAPAIREIYRALTVASQGSKTAKMFTEIICFILQEDDAYRFRFQWIVSFFPYFRPTIKHFELGLTMLEYAEVIGDMKERQRLFKRIIMEVLKDDNVRKRFDIFLKEVNWSKVKLTKADRYFFRAKYFKVDYPNYQY